ncbi:MAG: cation transporter [Oscillospiraceae bacterium]|nr:cation transporter [Oscillospiraceae bacterium]
MDRQNEAMRVSWISIAVNLLLAVGKLLAGLFAASGAMISDAIHSASDVFSTIVVMIGVKLADKEQDREHPYGHERMECAAAGLLAAALAVAGFEIGLGGVRSLITGAYRTAAVPGVLALVAAAVSIAVKEAMFWVTRRAARRTRSDALMADAWHHRSDALSSVGALAGIGAARLGWPAGDAVASLIICCMILWAAWEIYRDSLDKMVDHSADESTQQQIRQAAAAVPGVVRVDDMKTRMFGSRIYVDIEIAADSTLLLSEAHAIAEEVHRTVEADFDAVKHCMVHVNPA